jgi:hypothetical protein
MALSRNLLFGALAGAAATYVMTQFQNRTSPLVRKIEGSSSNRNDSNEEPATTRVAEKIYSSVRHADLPDDQKETAGSIVHYAFGTMTGLGFGALSGLLPESIVGRGLLYGGLVWLFADEIGTVAAKLAPPPSQVSKTMHAYGLASHLVYGAALSGIFQAA